MPKQPSKPLKNNTETLAVEIKKYENRN